MSESPLQDGLLLLLQAAEKIDRESSKSAYHHSERWETRNGSSRHLYDDGATHYSTYSFSSVHRRNAPSTRSTHNELEKSRRAHLRTCMDALKELLVFDSEAPRITTLTVLRKATSTIQQLQQRNEYLEACEDGEKHRFSQLMKRRQALRKKIEAKRNGTQKIQNWRERNRNYSECSVLTTSSEDSEMDYGSRHMPSNMYSILPQFCAIDNHRYASPVVTTKTEMSKAIPDSVVASGTTKTTTYAVYHRNKSEEKTSVGTTGMSPTDAYDASSSDSGFEEVITATSASDDQSAVKMEPPVISNTEEVVYTAASNCGSEYFKAY
ncbi:unnamed protein product [Hymenolepis diminuta]|uniref:BHLH domain-containing protein n=1 Tax=Hymenolepis diminuta TaxID=6216 RepID=A0A0R3SDA0_HYMDI|nr:unnamed protein product [Hymenolepis diminuta]VUZ56760.1 unnamed protein product [Hymenolepis diminuta]